MVYLKINIILIIMSSSFTNKKSIDFHGTKTLKYFLLCFTFKLHAVSTAVT